MTLPKKQAHFAFAVKLSEKKVQFINPVVQENNILSNREQLITAMSLLR